MGKPAVPLRYKLIALCAAGLLSCGFLPMLALADDSQDDSVAASFVLADSEGSGEAATPNPAVSSDSDGRAVLASSLASSTTSIVSADVALDAADPIVGSFTVDGLTYAVGADGLTLVAVAPDAVTDGTVAIPTTITYDGTTYPVAAIGSYAFYLSGATDVALPDSILSVDDRAFRSSDVVRVEVDAENPTYASFDGALYSADESRLLLIPEGRKGSVLLSCETEVVQASLFSHCSLVEAISVEEGGAAFSSWNGLLYSADGMTLLRVPAGATEITIRDGCTTIAAGALEGCAKLERINAPATVTSISPDVFASIPTVSLPAQMAVQDGTTSGVASSLPDQAKEPADPAPQLTAMVALSSADDEAPEVNPSSIEAGLAKGSDPSPWESLAFAVNAAQSQAGVDSPLATVETASSSSADYPYQTETSAMMAYANAEYLVDKSNNYFLAGERGRGSSLSVVVRWTAGTSSTPSHDAIVHYQVSGYVPNIEKFPAPVSGLASRWVRPECGELIGFYSDYYDYISLSEIQSGTFSFRVRASNLASGWHLGAMAFKPVFQKVKHSFYLNYAGTEDAPIQTLSPSFGEWNLPNPEPTRVGYTFGGWYNHPNCLEEGKVGSAFPTAVPIDQNYYAKWNPVKYPVTFNLDSYPSGYESGTFEQAGWSMSMDLTFDMATDGRIAIPTPARAGMRFLSWESDVDGLVSQEGTNWSIDCTRLPDAGTPTITARWAYAVSVDTPASVTFGEYDLATGSVTVDGSANESGLSDEWDIDAKAGSPVAFRSQSLCDVGIEAISSESREGASLIKAKEGAATDADARASELITMKVGSDAAGKRNAISFALDAALGKDELAPKTAFVIPAGGELPASFQLNLEENGAYVSDSSAGPVPESKELAQLSYVYRAIPYGTGSTADDMYIPYDAANPFGLADIKAAANDIAARGYDSDYWWLYKHLMYRDERGKTNAKVKWGDGTTYDVRIVGLKHDGLSDPEEGRSQAGVTFQFVDALKGTYRMNSTNDTSQGWGSFWLRGQMNEQSGSIMKQVPTDLRTAMLQVDKRYRNGAASNAGISISKDWLFLASYSEIVAQDYEPSFTDPGAEGPVYEFYKDAGTTGLSGAEYSVLVKTTPGSTVGQHWWGRSLKPGTVGYCHCIHRLGIAYGLHPLLNSNYVVPAFCL